MFFTSYEFLGFAALLLLVYYLVPTKFQQALLLAASCLFYGAAGPRFLLFIGTTTLTVYFAARKMGENLERQSTYLREHKSELSKEDKKVYKEAQKKIRLCWLVACLLGNLGILIVVKYANFLLSNISHFFALFGQEASFPVFSLALPLGISFYTLQAIGYLIDVYRGTVPAEKSLLRFALFISFFPQLIQGPINRYSDLTPTLFAPHRFDAAVVSRGLQRVLWGYFKKIVLADRILTAVRTITGDLETYQGAYALIGMLFYTLELYADFTGGIDITIGLSEAMGVSMQENFERPYFSPSLKVYWRRWHISMCNWFRDYVFYPLSVSPGMRKFSKWTRQKFGEKIGRRFPVYVSSFAVWLATGIWHGANWNFIVWGLCNWAILMISEELEPLYERFHQRFFWSQSAWYHGFQIARTFLLVCVLNLFDCYAALSDTYYMIASLFTARNWHILWDGSLLELGLSGLDYGIFGFGMLLVWGVSLVQRSGSVRDKIAIKPYPVRVFVWYGLFLAVLLMGAYGIGYDASQFIYNQF